MASPFLTLVAMTSVVGLCIGSFLNVVIHRLPRMMERSWREEIADVLRHFAGADDATADERAPLVQAAATLEDGTKRRFPGSYNLVTPNSSCPQCRHAIRPWENIPVLSFIFLRGRCSSCKTRISWRYPLIELVSGLLSAGAAWQFGQAGLSLQLAGALLMIWFLIALTMIDLDTQLLPDSMTLPLLWLGLLFNMFGAFTPLAHAVVGAVVGYLMLWTVYWVFKLLTGKDGMGFGDFKLLAALGAWLGWMHLPSIILAASVSGLVFALVQLAAARMGWDQKIPFGPYLAAGGLLSLFFGDQLLPLYMGG